MRTTTLEKKAREVIMEQMREHGNMDTEAVMELIRPHYSFNPAVAKEREIRRRAHSLMAAIKDEDGQRVAYNYTTAYGDSVYVNVKKTKSVDALAGVERQINKKYQGLSKAMRIVFNRFAELGVPVVVKKEK